MGRTIFSKAAFVESCSKGIHANVEIMMTKLGLIIKPPDPVLPFQTINDFVENISRNFVWSSWTVPACTPFGITAQPIALCSDWYTRLLFHLFGRKAQLSS